MPTVAKVFPPKATALATATGAKVFLPMASASATAQKCVYGRTLLTTTKKMKLDLPTSFFMFVGHNFHCLTVSFWNPFFRASEDLLCDMIFVLKVVVRITFRDTDQ